MKITTKTLLAITSSILVFFFVNEVSNYYFELKHVKKELYKKNETTYNTLIEMENNNIKSLALLFANNERVKEAYKKNDPEIIKEHILPFWKKALTDKLIYEIHFFKPPAESFVNFSNFKSIGKDVSDARLDIVWVTSAFKSSLHPMMCKTYAGLRATYPILDHKKDILGGLSMGKKIDWLPVRMKELSKSEAFLVYDKGATVTLGKKYFNEFMKDKDMVGEFILADRTIPVKKDLLKEIDFTKKIQNIMIDNKHYSLNIFKIRDFKKDGLAYVCVLNDLESFYGKFGDRLVKNIFLLIIVSIFVYILLRGKMHVITNKIKHLQDVTTELKVNNFEILETYHNGKDFKEHDELLILEKDIIEMGRALEISYNDLEQKVESRTIELEHEKNYIQKILDLTPNITLVTNGQKLLSANQRFFEFVEFGSLEDFLKEYNCICDYFISVNEKEFSKDHTIEDKIWAIYIAEHEQKVHTAIIRKDEKLYHFKLSAIYIDETEVLVTLQDVTELKKKEALLYEQSKLAAMGEMIGNIAHQWRQPLSVISTSATGMRMQKEFDSLTDEKFFEACDMINDHSQYLSQTIEDFRNFIKDQRDYKEFNIKDSISSFLHLIDGAAKAYNIELVLDTDKEIITKGYPNELVQCFINLFSNSKDVLNELKDERVLFIETALVDDKIFIIFKDNGGGIATNIISKVFEPYFTTKHQSQGTGLGLHMTHKLIVEGMGGTIEVSNTNVTYKGQNYNGAKFSIVIPQNK